MGTRHIFDEFSPILRHNFFAGWNGPFLGGSYLIQVVLRYNWLERLMALGIQFHLVRELWEMQIILFER